jgi:enoyl-[acyl-carrier protein] reductase II
MQASSPEIAATAIGFGVSGIVAQGSEAGGHARGRIPLHALLRTIRQNWPDVLLLAAGGISDGTAVAAALRAGADGVWVGTALVAALEANAHPEYKRRLVDSPGKTLRTNVFGPEWPDQPYRLLATAAVHSAEGVPTGLRTAQSVKRDCFLIRQTCRMTCRSGRRCPLRPRPVVIGRRWSTRRAKG